MKDPVTGLNNRQQFLHILDCDISDAATHKVSLALLLVDIRQFSRINMKYGYAAGDGALQAVASALEQVRREGDHIARVGDDKFGLILSGVLNTGHAEMAAHKIKRLLDMPLLVGEESIACKVSIGISVYPEHARSGDKLMAAADEAQRRARSTGQLLCVAHDDECAEESEHWDIEMALEDAIHKSELRVYFQPKISLATGRPVGAEALVRWENDFRGLIGPNEFIPVAESSGFIRPLTEWMLNSALRLAGMWEHRWGVQEVSVNIPPCVLDRSDFVDTVISAQKLWYSATNKLCIEIVEQSFIENVENAFSKLNRLRDEGISVSIDDFGTGYSSLAYFRDIPADQLKIDQSFVFGLLKDRDNANIVELIVDLAHRFGLSVVAEGVEDIQTLSALKKMQCDIAQGFFIARPMPAEEYHEWLANYRGINASGVISTSGAETARPLTTD
ncbi:diguanylate cyclase (GGDEF)-like protein [Thiogranum longum]|uniref:Diguanylate cyclase (GGDEF)-like protein n=1 Tax=Thiogranum longum TaxID=1537524 RepID=A0A4R1H7S2_9GAMM|nr:bifunctional diguanylate cyclase/phosphodiesterase [Thiogranum longum]TCK17877.1 diguanylate cyclase (GGDEF)-like protein [Thiogranum longum]